MDDEGRQRRIDGDDSLLASVAGVPLTRMARIALCLIWAGFWAARILLTDALYAFQQLRLKSAITELLGEGPVDQAFSICMIWLSFEVAATVWEALKIGASMLFAKSSKSFTALLLERLPREQLVAELERRDKADDEKPPENKGKKS